MAWYLNPALGDMRAEVNARYPNRDKTSDGTIGDAAHQATVSDHNPDADGSVDAWDMDVDLRSGDDARAIEWLKQRFQAHPASLYWIHNRQIADRRYGWRREAYTGANPHDKHVHWNTREAYENSGQPWGIREEDMALSTDDINKVALATARAVHNQRLGASQVTIGQAIQGTHQFVVELGTPDATADEIAEALRAALGAERAAAVGAALVAG